MLRIGGIWTLLCWDLAVYLVWMCMDLVWMCMGLANGKSANLLRTVLYEVKTVIVVQTVECQSLCCYDLWRSFLYVVQTHGFHIWNGQFFEGQSLWIFRQLNIRVSRFYTSWDQSFPFKASRFHHEHFPDLLPWKWSFSLCFYTDVCCLPKIFSAFLCMAFVPGYLFSVDWSLLGG